MQNCYVYILFIVGNLIFNNCLAQNYLIQVSTLTTEQGLPSTIISRIKEDSRGFIWIATNRGLCRYDGKNIKVFFPESDGGSHCYDIVEDPDGNLWTRFHDEKNKNNPAKRQTSYIIDKHFAVRPIGEMWGERLPFAKADINDIKRLMDGNLYISTKYGEIYRYDGINITRIFANALVNHFAIFASSTQDSIYLNCSKKILTIDRNGKLLKEEITPLINSFSIIDASNNQTGFPWFKRKIVTILRSGNQYHVRQLIKDRTEQLNLMDKKNVNFVWQRIDNQYFMVVAAANYLALFDDTGKLIINFSSTLQKQLNSFFANGVLLRKNQLLFKYNNGVGIINFQVNTFDQYLKTENQTSIRGIISLNNDNLLVNSYKGLYEIMPTKQVNLVSSRMGGGRGLQQITAGDILIGQYGSRVIHFQLEEKQFRYLEVSEASVQEHRSTSCFVPFEDKHQNIWIGTTHGLLTFDANRDSLKVFEKYNEFSQLEKESVNYFQEEADGVWLGTSNGLYVLDTEQGIVAAYQPLPDMRIFHFYRNKETFWLATYGQGLVKWNKKTGEAQRFGIKDGFLNESLMAVYPDTMGQLWMGTEEGLVRFDTTTKAVRIYLESDGITHREFNRSSHLQTADGRIYMGGLNGITAFHPTDIKESETIHYPFHVTDYYELDVEEGGFVERTSQLLDKKSIVLNSNIQSVRVHFALMNFKNVNKNRYACKIKGFDKDWTLQKEDFIRINHLPYGDYTLQIKAIDYTGNYSKNELTFPIKVIAPFYQQTAWQLLGVGLLSLLFYIIYRQRLRMARQEQERLERIIKERTATISQKNEELSTLNETKDRLFAILAHDLRNPVLAFQNLAEKINYLLERNEPGRVLTLGKFINRQARELEALLSNLLNWALYERGDIFINKEYFLLIELINDLIEKNTSLVNTIKVKVINDIPVHFQIYSDYLVLTTILRNLLSNAFRYTPPGGWIKFSVAQTARRVIIKVEDNGAGINEAQVATLFKIHVKQQAQKGGAKVSFGLHLCKELAEMLNGRLSVESVEGEGTSFFIDLPLEVEKQGEIKNQMTA